MDHQQKAIVLLLKSAITGEAYPLPEDFSLEQAIPLIKKHHMVTLVYDGALTCGIPQDVPAMQKLFPLYLRLLLRSEKQQESLVKLQNTFREENIDHMLLKGSRMKHLYPKPELRYMGDADILIRTEQYDRIRPIMESLGYQEGKENEYELHWNSHGLKAELHKHIIPPEQKDWYAYFNDGWKLAKPVSSGEYRMRPEDEWIYLFTHFAKHYRNGGVGCRYVVDLWVWQRTHTEMDELYIRKVVKTLRMERFYDNILRLLEYWFAGTHGDPLLDTITDYIFDSGSWGSSDSFAVSKTVRDIKQTSWGFSGRLLYIWKSFFPPREVLRYEYPILQKSVCWLPLVWLHRILRKTLIDRKVLTTKLKSIRSMSSENLTQRQKMLQMVGLDDPF